MKDQEIITLLRIKPAEGLREAMRCYGGLLQVVVSRILPGSPQDVEECVADVFINAWKTIHRLEDGASLKGYLLCIARNTAINRYHKLKRSRHATIEGLELADGGDMALTVINDEILGELMEEVAAMEEPDREIVIRKYFLFESLREIGNRLGLTEEQVKKRLYRSRQRLKVLLQKRGITREAI